jgi:hypothetical protein
MPETPITFEDVEVVSATDMTLRCRVQGKVVVIGVSQYLHGTTVRGAGDRGRLILPRWAVQELGLTEPTSQ